MRTPRFATALILPLLLAACTPPPPAEETATTPENVIIGWQVQPEAPGPYDQPRFSLALMIAGSEQQAVMLGSYAGSFADGRTLAVPPASGALLTGTAWWAGAGDEFVVRRVSDDTVEVQHREVDEQVEPAAFAVLTTVSIPANATIDLAPPVATPQ